jgi:hypothetical protein
MLVLACTASYATKFILNGWGYRILFFLLGAGIPIIDVPYVNYLHNSYCEGNIGLQVYKEIEPQDHFYIANTGYLSTYEFFSEKINFIEHYDSRKKELWKVTKVDKKLVKEPIKEATSIYQYVDQGSTYPVDYGVEKVISRQIREIGNGQTIAETVWFTNVKPYGWFFSSYYPVRSDCSATKKKAIEEYLELRSLLIR